MRSSPSITPVDPLLQAATLAQMSQFTALKSILEKISLDKLVMTSEQEAALLSLYKNLLEKNIELFALLNSKVAASAKTWVKPAMQPSEIRKTEVRFNDEVKKDRSHEKLSSMNLARPTVPVKMSAISKTLKELRELPLLQESILPITGDKFKQLVKSIAIWDAHCVSKYTYHSIRQPIENHFNGLESWLVLSLLHARFAPEKFNHVLENMINLREALCDQKQYNAMLFVSSILESSILAPMMNKQMQNKVLRANEKLQAQLKKDEINFGHSIELLAKLKSTIGAPGSKITVPIVVMNNCWEKAKESGDGGQQKSVSLAKGLISLMQTKLKDDLRKTKSSNLQAHPQAQALWDLPRVSMDNLDDQIDIVFKKNSEGKSEGSTRTWKQNNEYLECVPSPVVSISSSAPKLTVSASSLKSSAEAAKSKAPEPASAVPSIVPDQTMPGTVSSTTILLSASSSVKNKIQQFQAAIEQQETGKTQSPRLSSSLWATAMMPQSEAIKKDKVQGSPRLGGSNL